MIADRILSVWLNEKELFRWHGPLFLRFTGVLPPSLVATLPNLAEIRVATSAFVPEDAT